MFTRTWLAPLVLAVAGTALAQTPPEAVAPTPSTVDANETREELMQLLQRHPSEVGEVLARAPQLLANDDYMASYPALKAFVAQHPEVAANPGYFFSGYAGYAGDRNPVLNFWENFLGVLAAICVGIFAALLLAWLVKTLLEQRRWNRLQRVQAEVHQKVLDRLGTNEQLMAYIETPAGRRFLESAPIPLEGPRPLSAPISRVLWSMQVGVVLVCVSLGLVAASNQLPSEGHLPMWVIGIATLSLGVGFVVSSLVSFLLSRRLGLMTQPQPSPEL